MKVSTVLKWFAGAAVVAGAAYAVKQGYAAHVAKAAGEAATTIGDAAGDVAVVVTEVVAETTQA